jgi:hypothetical protein
MEVREPFAGINMEVSWGMFWKAEAPMYSTELEREIEVTAELPLKASV